MAGIPTGNALDLFNSMAGFATDVINEEDKKNREQAEFEFNNIVNEFNWDKADLFDRLKASDDPSDWDNQVETLIHDAQSYMEDKNSKYYCSSPLVAKQVQSMLDRERVNMMIQVQDMIYEKETEHDITAWTQGIQRNRANKMNAQDQINFADTQGKKLVSMGKITQDQFYSTMQTVEKQVYSDTYINGVKSLFAEGIASETSFNDLVAKYESESTELNRTDIAGLPMAVDHTDLKESLKKQLAAEYQAEIKTAQQENASKLSSIYVELQGAETEMEKLAIKKQGIAKLKEMEGWKLDETTRIQYAIRFGISPDELPKATKPVFTGTPEYYQLVELEKDIVRANEKGDAEAAEKARAGAIDLLLEEGPGRMGEKEWEAQLKKYQKPVTKNTDGAVGETNEYERVLTKLEAKMNMSDPTEAKKYRQEGADYINRNLEDMDNKTIEKFSKIFKFVPDPTVFTGSGNRNGNTASTKQTPVVLEENSGLIRIPPETLKQTIETMKEKYISEIFTEGMTPKVAIQEFQDALDYLIKSGHVQKIDLADVPVEEQEDTLAWLHDIYFVQEVEKLKQKYVGEVLSRKGFTRTQAIVDKFENYCSKSSDKEIKNSSGFLYLQLYDYLMETPNADDTVIAPLCEKWQDAKVATNMQKAFDNAVDKDKGYYIDKTHTDPITGQYPKYINWKSNTDKEKFFKEVIPILKNNDVVYKDEDGILHWKSPEAKELCEQYYREARIEISRAVEGVDVKNLQLRYKKDSTGDETPEPYFVDTKTGQEYEFSLNGNSYEIINRKTNNSVKPSDYIGAQKAANKAEEEAAKEQIKTNKETRKEAMAKETEVRQEQYKEIVELAKVAIDKYSVSSHEKTDIPYILRQHTGLLGGVNMGGTSEQLATAAQAIEEKLYKEAFDIDEERKKKNGALKDKKFDDKVSKFYEKTGISYGEWLRKPYNERMKYIFTYEGPKK